MGYYLRQSGGYYNAYDSLSNQLIASGDMPWLSEVLADLGYYRHDYLLSIDPRTQDVARVSM